MSDRVRCLSVKRNSFTETTGTVGTVAATLLAANNEREYLLVQNTHASNTLYISLGGTATSSHVQIASGAALVFESGTVPSCAISGIGSAAGTTYIVVAGVGPGLRHN
tara:strand:+ start:349 stop:672 length:324 start_codon:yes stop_codon:yes gene_type:complete